jgi:hypothetical protein
MVKMDQYHKVGGYYWQIPWVLVNLCFQQDSIRKSVRRIKTSNRIKLNHDENYSKMFQRTPEDTTLQWTPRGCQVGPTSPTTMSPGPLWGPLVRSFQNVSPPPPRIASTPFLKSVWSKGSDCTPRDIYTGLHPPREKPNLDPKSWKARNPNSYFHQDLGLAIKRRLVLNRI